MQCCVNGVTLLLGSVPPGSSLSGFVSYGADADKPRRMQLAEPLLAVPILCSYTTAIAGSERWTAR